MKNLNKISDAELEIMKILWDSKELLTAFEIFTQLKEFLYWEESTVRTLILRLTQKGFLIQEKRNVYYYSTTISETQYMKEQTKTFLDKVYGGEAKKLVASLFEDDYLSSEDVEEIKDFWKKGSDKNE